MFNLPIYFIRLLRNGVRSDSIFEILNIFENINPFSAKSQALVLELGMCETPSNASDIYFILILPLGTSLQTTLTNLLCSAKCL